MGADGSVRVGFWSIRGYTGCVQPLKFWPYLYTVGDTLAGGRGGRVVY